MNLNDKIRVKVGEKVFDGEVLKVMYKEGKMRYTVKYTTDKGVTKTEEFLQKDVIIKE